MSIRLPPWWRFGRNVWQHPHGRIFHKHFNHSHSTHYHLRKDEHDAHGEKKRRKDELLELRLALTSRRMDDLVPRRVTACARVREHYSTESLVSQISEVFSAFCRKQKGESQMDGSTFRKVAMRPPSSLMQLLNGTNVYARLFWRLVLE